MASWKLAPALVKLRDEINKEFPLRDKTSDGSLGNAAHSARYSDHNPNANRVVCAIDIDEDLEGSKNKVYPRFNSGQAAKAELVDRLIKQAKAGKLPQLYYVIYEGKIYQRKYGFAARTYNGPNKHDHHVHVSVSQTPSLYNKTSSWNLFDKDVDPKPTPIVDKPNNTDGVNKPPVDTRPVIDYSNLHAAIKSGEKSPDVLALQKALKSKGLNPGTVDGFWGAKTRRAVALYQVKISDSPKPAPYPDKGWDAGDGKVDKKGDADGIPGRQSLGSLGFRVRN